jgi:chemotaxis signal transduction protein
MTEHKHTDETAPPPGEPTTTQSEPMSQSEPPPTRELLLLHAGGQTFAVYAEETEAVAAGLKPAPLPHAPRAVLGVVCVRGRMYTLLDPHALLRAQSDNPPAPAREETHEETHGDAREEMREAAREEVREAARGPVVAFVVALRGDEQLALAADGIERAVSVPAGALETPDPPALRATLELGGARVHVLDPSRLFDAATQGTERRRQRL